MAEQVDVYYDFRSPYAYFAAWRILRERLAAPVTVNWRWRPVSIDILLNLQAGRDPCAAYVDPLAAPKRRHLVADVRRCAAFYGAPLVPPCTPRPDPVPALCVAQVLEQRGVRSEPFLMAVFEEMWGRAGRIDAREVLARCLRQVSLGEDVLNVALSAESRSELTARSVRAYEAGVFGVPSFVHRGEIYFGSDRLDMLTWRMQN